MSELDSPTAIDAGRPTTALIVAPKVERQADSSTIVGFAIAALLVAGAVVTILGWMLIFKILLWGVVVACGLIGILSAIAANNTGNTESEKSGYWISAGAFAFFATVAWIALPSDTAKTFKTAAISSNSSLTPQGQRTVEYWNRFGSVVGRATSRQPKTPQEVIASCNQLAYDIDQLPAMNVDPDAIRGGLALRTWLVALASETERRNSPEAFVGAFVRGFQGDVFGPFLDESAATTAMGQSLREVQNQLVSTRAILSSRYGTEFSRIQF